MIIIYYTELNTYEFRFIKFRQISLICVGTTAFVIDTSNGTKHWVKINPFGGSIEDNDETDQLLYDGGSIDNSDPV